MAENGEQVTYFGETDARGKRVRFGIRAKDRTKHMYVIGKTGMGKSTLLENMAIQDIENGEGLAFVDPHGSSAEKLLDYIPEERIKDTLYFAPFDLGHPVSFNILEDMGPDKRHLVVNGLMSTFEKLWADMWSARMSYILQNTIQALLEYPDSTLLGINRVLVDKNYRKKVVNNVKDPAVRAFWLEEFAKYTDRYTQEATPAIQNKVGQFVSNPLIRNIIGQPNSAFDIREIMDKKKILIANLSKGKVGEGNANLLGGMLITRIYLAAMSRADASERELQTLPNFNLYVDEFQSFANKTFENILSEARKYKLNLTIAHQYIEQMEEEVRNAVFGNVGTMITFRVGAYDAEVLEKEFAPTFYADNLVNLGVYQMYLKLMINGVSSQPFSAVSMPPISPPALSFREQIIDYTRTHFGRPRAEVEAEIKKWHEAIMPPDVLAGTVQEKHGGSGNRSAETRPPKEGGWRGADRSKGAGGRERREEGHRENLVGGQPNRSGEGYQSRRGERPPDFSGGRSVPALASASASAPERERSGDSLSRTRAMLLQQAHERTEQKRDGEHKTIPLSDLKKHTTRRNAGEREREAARSHNRGQSGAQRRELRDALAAALAAAPVPKEPSAAAQLREEGGHVQKGTPHKQSGSRSQTASQQHANSRERSSQQKPEPKKPQSQDTSEHGAPRRAETPEQEKPTKEVPEATLRKILEE